MLNIKETYIAKVQRAVGGRLTVLIGKNLPGRGSFFITHIPQRSPMRKFYDPDHWTLRKLARSALSWFKRGLRVLLRRL